MKLPGLLKTPPTTLPRLYYAATEHGIYFRFSCMVAAAQLLYGKRSLRSYAITIICCIRLKRIIRGPRHVDHSFRDSVDFDAICSVVARALQTSSRTCSAAPSGSLTVLRDPTHHRSILQSSWSAFVNRPAPAFYLIDAAAPVRRLIFWKTFLPEITPYYAVKCNPDLMIVTALAAAGASFDVASPFEIDLVLQAGVQLHELNERAIFANPTKAISAVEHSAAAGLYRMTCDSEEEVLKCIAATGGRVELVVRLAVDNKGAINPLSKKFGASPVVACRIVDLCARLGAPAVGVSFHVGSAATDPSSYGKALLKCRAVFEYAAAKGYPMNLVDLGGGWPGSDTAENIPVADGDTEGSAGRAPHPPFPTFAARVMDEVNRYFPPAMRKERKIRLIAEPGRFMATSATTLVCEIISKKVFYSCDAAPDGVPEMLAVGPGTPTAFTPEGVFGVDLMQREGADESASTVPLRPAEGESSAAAADAWRLLLAEVTESSATRAVHARVPVRVHYHLSDGVYGGMNSALTDHVRPLPHVLFERGRLAQHSKGPSKHPKPPVSPRLPQGGEDSDTTSTPPPAPPVLWLPSSLYGPTCDDLDVINHGVLLPSDLRIGEWLYFRCFGAYTQCLETRFNGFAPPARYYCFSMPDRWAVEGRGAARKRVSVRPAVAPPARSAPASAVDGSAPPPSYSRSGVVVGGLARTPCGDDTRSLEWAYRRFVLPPADLGELDQEAGEWTVVARSRSDQVGGSSPLASVGVVPRFAARNDLSAPSKSRGIRLRQVAMVGDELPARMHRALRH